MHDQHIRLPLEEGMEWNRRICVAQLKLINCQLSLFMSSTPLHSLSVFLLFFFRIFNSKSTLFTPTHFIRPLCSPPLPTSLFSHHFSVISPPFLPSFPSNNFWQIIFSLFLQFCSLRLCSLVHSDTRTQGQRSCHRHVLPSCVCVGGLHWNQVVHGPGYVCTLWLYVRHQSIWLLTWMELTN